MVEITHLSWGRIEVNIDGETRQFKDCKIWPGGAREWNWHETGTQHDLGIQPADIEEIVEKGAEVLILARGQWGRLRVRPETEAYLRARRVAYHVAETPQAVAQFNDLARQGRRVGGVFHSTC